MKTRLLGDTAVYFAGLLLVAGIELVRAPLLGRLLGPAEYGRFTLIFGASAFIALLGSSWLTGATVRFMPEHEAKGEADRFSALSLLLGLSSALGLGAVLLAAWFPLRPLLPGLPTSLDVNGDLVVNVPDIFAFLSAWFAGTADFDGSGATNVPDIFAYLSAWFAGC